MSEAATSATSSAPPGAAPTGGDGQAGAAVGTVPQGAAPAAGGNPAPVTPQGGQATQPNAGATPPAGTPPPTPPAPVELQMPAGIEIDTDAVGEIKSLMADGKLTPESAQAVVEIGAKMQARAVEAHNATVTGWVTTLKSDPEFGAEYDANAGKVQELVTKFGDQSVKDFFNSSGVGNHPGLVKMLWRASKELLPSTKVVGGVPTGAAQPSAAAVMFPTMVKKG